MLLNLLGSLGLFLLGMWLMTEGLKLAGGRALGTLLGRWTSSRIRGLASGILITALVQSSSAVTVATLGFVNAGLMTFQRALWVVFGSNLGTTFTAWLVTLFGFKFSIDNYTFALVGIGAALRLFAPRERAKALGMALAGFGLLFMGIDALQNTFGGYAAELDLESLLNGGSFQLGWGLLIGMLLTLLTQSSSAAIAIILTAAATGVAGMDVAAAAVIGANVGTTSTAFIASMGATANARRLAWAHVVFNGVTALVAMAGLPVFLVLISRFANPLTSAENLSIFLAGFHTAFNLLGVLLMWPLQPHLSRFLLGLYRRSALGSSVHSHLDANVATVPDLALRAMALELDALMARASRLELPVGARREASLAGVEKLEAALGRFNDFVALSFTGAITGTQSQLMTLALAASHHLHYACDTLKEIDDRFPTIEQSDLGASKSLQAWLKQVDDYNRQMAGESAAAKRAGFPRLTEDYRRTKDQLLSAAVNDRANLSQVDIALQVASLARRFCEQLLQAREACEQLTGQIADY